MQCIQASDRDSSLLSRSLRDWTIITASEAFASMRSTSCFHRGMVVGCTERQLVTLADSCAKNRHGPMGSQLASDQDREKNTLQVTRSNLIA